MKRFFPSLLLLFFFSDFSFSQDIIVYRSGQEIKVVLIKITEQEIVFKRYGISDSPEYTVRKDQVSAIKFANGTTESLSVSSAGNNDLIKTLENKIKQDSITLLEFKNIQQNSNLQNKELLESINALAENLTKNNEQLLEELKKQHSETIEQSKEATEQSRQISGNIAQLNHALTNKKSDDEETDWIPPWVGLGLDIFEPMFTSFAFDPSILFLQQVAPRGSTVYLTVKSRPHVRFEPYGGFAYTNKQFSFPDSLVIPYSPVNDTALDMSLSLQLYNWGGKVVLMYQHGKTNTYFGMLVSKVVFKTVFEINYSRDTVNFLNYHREKINSSGVIWGPVIGAEYALGKHFTIGGEIAAVFYSENPQKVEISGRHDKDQYIGTTLPQTSFTFGKDKITTKFHAGTTQPRLILRFYF